MYILKQTNNMHCRKLCMLVCTRDACLPIISLTCLLKLDIYTVFTFIILLVTLT